MRRWWAANSRGTDLPVDETGCVNVAHSPADGEHPSSRPAPDRSWLAPGLMEREIRADAISVALATPTIARPFLRARIGSAMRFRVTSAQMEKRPCGARPIAPVASRKSLVRRRLVSTPTHAFARALRLPGFNRNNGQWHRQRLFKRALSIPHAGGEVESRIIAGYDKSSTLFPRNLKIVGSRDDKLFIISPK